MDNYEMRILLQEIDSLVADRRLQEAAELSDQIDWRRVKRVRTLCKVSDIYKANRRYEDSKQVLEMAYAKTPKDRRIIFSLCELELKLGNFVRALQLYNEFRHVAPEDPDGYVLQYKLYKAQNVGVRERIAVLEELEKADFREKWAYELARLYYEAGERMLCISACDELIAFFGNGRYVLKALELKGSLTDLNPSQKRRYAALLRAAEARSTGELASVREAEPAVQETAEPAGQEASEPAAQEQPAPEEPAPAKVSTDTMVYRKKTQEEILPQLDLESVPQEIPWDYEEPEEQEQPVRVRNAAVTRQMPVTSEAAPAEQEKWETAPEEEITQEAMQQMIAKGLQELHNYDTYLSQETDGQYALVMQEDPAPEQQIPGQLGLEEIMAEWEKVRRSLDDPEDTVVQEEKEKPEGGKEPIRRRTTKSWDPEAVHDALRIRDNDNDGVNFDTSLFVTEDGGEFPEEYIPEVRGGIAPTGNTGRLFPYIHSEDSMRRLMAALENVRLEGAAGNVIITGDEGSGTMSLARELLQRYRLKNPSFVGQIVKTEGYLMDRDNLSRVIVRIPYGALVIERASSMSEEAALAMQELLSVPERNGIVVMIDRKGNMDAFLRDHPEIAAMFGARVDIAALSVDTLLGYAREYAGKQNCEIDEYGIGALQSRILSMQTVEHSVTLEDVRDLVDEAVYYAGRSILPGLRNPFAGRAGILRLRDRDFLHF